NQLQPRDKYLDGWDWKDGLFNALRPKAQPPKVIVIQSPNSESDSGEEALREILREDSPAGDNLGVRSPGQMAFDSPPAAPVSAAMVEDSPKGKSTVVSPIEHLISNMERAFFVGGWLVKDVYIKQEQEAEAEQSFSIQEGDMVTVVVDGDWPPEHRKSARE